MIRVSKLTDYGVGMMAYLAERGHGAMATAPDMSEVLQLPLPTVRKILKILTRENLLVSQRGVAGGYSLARRPKEITLMDMVTALEGPVAVTECSSGEPCGCAREEVCGLRENWSWVNSVVQSTLESYSLDQMVRSLPRLEIVKNNNLQDLNRMRG